MSSTAYPSALDVLGTLVFLVLNLNLDLLVLCRYCCLDTLRQSAKTTGIGYQVHVSVGFIELQQYAAAQAACSTSALRALCTHHGHNTRT